MKKVFSIITIAALLVLYSCGKNNNASGGSWTWRGLTYQSQFTDFVLGELVSSTGTNSPTGSLNFVFYYNPDSATLKPGNYTVTYDNPPADSTHVFVFLTDTSATNTYAPTYSATRANIQATVTVTKGSFTITLPPTEMAHGTDSSVLTAKVNYLP